MCIRRKLILNVRLFEGEEKRAAKPKSAKNEKGEKKNFFFIELRTTGMKKKNIIHRSKSNARFSNWIYLPIFCTKKKSKTKWIFHAILSFINIDAVLWLKLINDSASRIAVLKYSLPITTNHSLYIHPPMEIKTCKEKSKTSFGGNESFRIQIIYRNDYSKSMIWCIHETSD